MSINYKKAGHKLLMVAWASTCNLKQFRPWMELKSSDRELKVQIANIQTPVFPESIIQTGKINASSLSKFYPSEEIVSKIIKYVNLIRFQKWLTILLKLIREWKVRNMDLRRFLKIIVEKSIIVYVEIIKYILNK